MCCAQGSSLRSEDTHEIKMTHVGRAKDLHRKSQRRIDVPDEMSSPGMEERAFIRLERRTDP